MCDSKNHPDLCSCPQEVYDNYNKVATLPIVVSSDDESSCSSKSASSSSLKSPLHSPHFISLAQHGRFARIVKVFDLEECDKKEVWREMVMQRILHLKMKKARKMRDREEEAIERMKKVFGVK